MKLNEIFDADYYDQLQHQMKMKKAEKQPESDETEMQDFIISKYEANKISYDQAWKEIKKITPKKELFFWEMELGSARDMKGH